MTRTATDMLTAARMSLATDGQRPPCGQRDGHRLWLSDDAADRALAAGWCAGCPVIASGVGLTASQPQPPNRPRAKAA